MALMNFTTSISVEKTISEIESMLASSGANKILKEYDDKGSVSSISFMLNTLKGELPFKLPMNIEGVMQTINNQTGEYRKQKTRKGSYSGKQVRAIPQKFYNDYDQARRVGWRIIRDWLESQLAIYFLQMVKIEEIFLPYMYNSVKKKTFFELMEEKDFSLLLEDNSGGVR